MIKPMNSKNMRLGQVVPQGTKSSQRNRSVAFRDGHDPGERWRGEGVA